MVVVCDNHKPRQVMELVKNGVPVELSNAVEIDGDLYRCRLCGNRVITDFGEPQPKKTTQNKTSRTFL